MANWRNLKVSDLKTELLRQSLPTHGLKAELVQRLTDNGDNGGEGQTSIRWSHLNVKDLKDELEDRGLSTKGVKAVLVQRLADDDDNDDGTTPQLRESATVQTRTLPPDQRYLSVGCLVSPPNQAHKALRRFQGLVDKEWICVETIGSRDQKFGITRVYILPDDRDNGRIDRSDPKLRQKKQDLLSRLDFSSATWSGAPEHDAPAKFPPLSAAACLVFPEDHKSTSLLKMFNAIPSPRPDVDMIDDSFDRGCMNNLLRGVVGGVTTRLYPHQCRSAALMHQKEVQPTQFLDPRLMEVVDQNGDLYYYNAVTADIFREARYYDGVRGGILAEEMGSGKTLICLALITATKDHSSYVPDIYQGNNITIRPHIGSLMDMAAAVATKYANPWKRTIPPWHKPKIHALLNNPGWYYMPPVEPRRQSRGVTMEQPPRKIYLSHTTLVIVPANLVQQWLQEISKHTEGLKVHVIERNRRLSRVESPDATKLLEFDIVITSVEDLETLWDIHQRPEANDTWTFGCGLGCIRFKRCIVDEGHKLGNVKLSGAKTSILQVLDTIHADARWIATGTPAQGLFGVEEGGEKNTSVAESTAQQESKDLERIGAIATQYLKARPWSNTIHDYGDTLADWNVYIMQPEHNSRSGGRADCLRSTFNTLIVRHRLSEVSSILPAVDAKIVKLDGSYQDKLSLNLFSMMIIFNAVQSQRTDQDYFFHKNNRESLLELVSNLRQASFYGGAFFATESVRAAVQTAEEFIDQDNVIISKRDRKLLEAGIVHGKLAVANKMKDLSKRFHEPPLYVGGFPDRPPIRKTLWNDRPFLTRWDSPDHCAWAVDARVVEGRICTNANLMVAAQKALRPFLDPAQKDNRWNLTGAADIESYLNNGLFETAARNSRGSLLEDLRHEIPLLARTTRQATTLGEDHGDPPVAPSGPTLTQFVDEAIPTPPKTPEGPLEIPNLLANTQLTSTTSAKLSYLIDAITMHQKDEQIIVFYDNDNIAWYLAGVLDMLSIHHLIYAKGLTAQRRSQYVSTFNNTAKFRVLLMDINEAAVGLDMRAASRIYFINPVLNPQIEAQAIGRVRRISQKKRVTVETLVLKDSLEEVIMERKMNMTQAEHRKCKTILDDRRIYDYILKARIISMPDIAVDDGPAQMAPLKVPQYIFGLQFGRERSNPDEDILLEEPSAALNKSKTKAADDGSDGAVPPVKKRTRFADDETAEVSGSASAAQPAPSSSRTAKRTRFADIEEEKEE